MTSTVQIIMIHLLVILPQFLVASTALSSLLIQLLLEDAQIGNNQGSLKNLVVQSSVDFAQKAGASDLQGNKGLINQ